jgi:hypothetical protein
MYSSTLRYSDYPGLFDTGPDYPTTRSNPRPSEQAATLQTHTTGLRNFSLRHSISEQSRLTWAPLTSLSP